VSDVVAVSEEYLDRICAEATAARTREIVAMLRRSADMMHSKFVRDSLHSAANFVQSEYPDAFPATPGGEAP
jgi:hypothetical protein